MPLNADFFLLHYFLNVCGYGYIICCKFAMFKVTLLLLPEVDYLIRMSVS